ncbi:MAG: MarR family transcriptional regulator [Rhodobiaceae bacterium]|nr:MarR family transcriptional regulator [Rhodobiaceae bacterium]
MNVARQPRLFHLIQLAHRALFRAADQTLQSAFGLSAVQQGALFVIGKDEPCHPSAIARALDMNKSAVTTLLSRLEDAGFVRRMADPDDGRAQLVQLSEKGRRTVSASVPHTKAANARLLEGFSPEEIIIIERFLTQVIERSSRASSTPDKSTPLTPSTKESHHDHNQ